MRTPTMPTLSYLARTVILCCLLLLVGLGPHARAQGSGAAYVHIAVGPNFAFALQSNGQLWAWGENFYGNLGDGTFITRTQPVPVAEPTGAAPGSRWTRIFAHGSGSAVYALRSDQSFWRWGDGQNRPVQVPLTTTLPTGATLADLAISEGHFLALYSDGSLYSWGSNSQGQLGLGPTAGTGTRTTPQPVLTPATAAPGTRWTSITVEFNQSFAVRSDGSLWSWGGVPNTIPSTLGHPVTASGCFTPELVPAPASAGPGTGWVSVAAGETHTLALRSDGTLWAWGFSNRSALGQGMGGTASTAVPVPIPVPAGRPAGTRWQRIQAGGQSSQGILSDGTLWAWGDNLFGQLGVNSPSGTENTPQQEYNQEVWTESGFGINYAVALSRGRVYVTGSGPNGQLGLGNGTSRLFFFVRIVGLPLASAGEPAAAGSPDVFPNPAAVGQELTLTGSATGLGSWAELINSQGQRVGTGPLINQRLRLPALAPGLYVLRWFDQDHLRGARKLTIQ